MSDKFRLTRIDHQTGLVGSIMEETDFCDVTLASENQQLRAHKVVLAASSPKLRSILLNNPHPNPLIYLTGVKSSIMENLVKFIYHGEVDVLLHVLLHHLALVDQLHEVLLDQGLHPSEVYQRVRVRIVEEDRSQLGTGGG